MDRVRSSGPNAEQGVATLAVLGDVTVGRVRVSYAGPFVTAARMAGSWYLLEVGVVYP